MPGVRQGQKDKEECVKQVQQQQIQHQGPDFIDIAVPAVLHN